MFDQGTKVDEMRDALKNLKPQFCSGSHIKSFDPNTQDLVREMLVNAKMSIVQLGDREFDLASKNGKKYKGNITKDNNFLEGSKYCKGAQTDANVSFFAEPPL